MENRLLMDLNLKQLRDFAIFQGSRQDTPYCPATFDFAHLELEARAAFCEQRNYQNHQSDIIFELAEALTIARVFLIYFYLFFIMIVFRCHM